MHTCLFYPFLPFSVPFHRCPKFESNAVADKKGTKKYFNYFADLISRPQPLSKRTSRKYIASTSLSPVSMTLPSTTARNRVAYI